MSFIESKGVSCRDYLSDVCLSSCVRIMVEECIEIFNLFDIESWILCNDGFAENSLPLIFKHKLAINFAHGYISSNII
jgi:hypothetical protein